MFMFGKFRSDTRDTAHRIKNIEYLRLNDTIVQIQSVTPGFDQPGVFQDHQLLRDIRLP
jgi:hypothetical protein